MISEAVQYCLAGLVLLLLLTPPLPPPRLPPPTPERLTDGAPRAPREATPGQSHPKVTRGRPKRWNSFRKVMFV